MGGDVMDKELIKMVKAALSAGKIGGAAASV